MRMDPSCEECLLGKSLDNYPEGTAPEVVSAYQRALRWVVKENPDKSAPEMVELLGEVRKSYFGESEDFAEIKYYFNDLMMKLEPDMFRDICDSEDPFKRAVQYAMTANFIDFGALDNVSSDKLKELLGKASETPFDEVVLEQMRGDIMNAERLAYFTDNCGEIVADRMVMKTIRMLRPDIHMTAVVRGKPAMNDATMEDARQIGLEETADLVMGNGSGITGTVIEILPDDVMDVIREADVMIAKGQGNFESMSGCGYDVYYIFMCKCRLFMDRFNVPQFYGILARETERPSR